MDEFFFSIPDLYKEAETRSLYRARMQDPKATPIPFDNLLLTEAEHDMMGDYLKTAADEVYWKLQTLMKVEDAEDYEEGDLPYDFSPGVSLTYNIVQPDNFNSTLLTVIYTLIKDYLVEGILKGYYEEVGYEKGIMISTSKQERQMDRMQSYRIARTTPVTKRYTML